MYRSTQELRAWFERVASSACRPQRSFENIRYGDPQKEEYELGALLTERRELSHIRDHVVAARRETKRLSPEWVELIKLERSIEAELRKLKQLPKAKATFSQCFMTAAHMTLNEDVFQRIREQAQLLYYRNDLTRGSGTHG